MNDDELNLFDEDVLVSTASYHLRPIRETDEPDLLVHFADPEVVEFMDIDPLEDTAEAHGIVAWATGLREFGDGVRFVIRDKATGAFIGTAGFNTLEVDRGRRGEIAYDIARDFWGKGVMAEVLPKVIDLGFGNLGLRRLDAFVTPGNTRSTQLLERHGFQLEGRLRDYGYWKGQFWDQLLFARLSED